MSADRPTTQGQRLLRAFKREGNRGLDPTQWLGPNVYDNSGPILNFGGRVAELRAAGHRLEARGRRNRCRVIVLVTAPAPAPTAPSTAPELFNRATGAAPPRSPFDPWDGER